MTDRARTGLVFVAVSVIASMAIGEEGDSAVRARDVALLLSGREGGRLPLEVAAGFPARRVADGVRLVAELPAAPLLERAGPEAVRLTIVVYAVGEESRIVGTAVERLAVDPGRLAASTAPGLRLVVDLPMPPEPVDLRVLVRVSGVGGDAIFGLRTVAFEPPPPPEGRGPPEAVRWVSVTPVAETSSWLEPESVFGEELPPALPAVTAGDRLPIVLLSRSVPADPPDLRLVRPGEDGEGSRSEGRRIEIEELAAEADQRGSWRRHRGVIRLPDIEPGRYRLRLVGAATVQELLVTAGSVAGLTWAELMSPRPVDADAPSAGAEKVRKGPTVRALREAIAAFVASGEESDVADPGSLSTLYRETWRRAGPEGLEILVEAVGRLGVRLRRQDPAALLPLVAAHGDLYRTFLEQRLWGMASSTRRATIILLDLFSTGPERSSEGLASPRRSAGALGWSRLGDEVLEANLLDHAVAFYERALGLSPTQPHALAMLGAIYERVGEYEKAETMYRRLVKEDPGAEGRLRLAIQSRRLNHTAAARSVLSELLATETPPWIDVVAAQELADLELEAGRTGSAIEILDRALAEYPDEESLLVQRAAVSELAGDHAEAVEVLERLGSPEPDRVSPRHRYARWPPERTGRLEEPFEAVVAATRGRLVAAVEEFGWR